MPARLTPEKYKDRLTEKGLNYRLVGEYTTGVTPTNHQCGDCGSSFDARPKNLLNGSERCYNCRPREMVRCDNSEYDKILAKLGTNLTRMGEYKTGHIAIDHYCSSCDSIVRMRPISAKLGSRCNKCASFANRKNNEDHDADLVLRGLGNSYRRVGDYEHCEAKIDHECLSCGNVWKISPNKLFKGRGCPKCNHGGFNTGQPGTLYYFRIQDEEGKWWYKLGITNLQVHKRYSKRFLGKVEMLCEWFIDDGFYCRALEQSIHKKYSHMRKEVPKGILEKYSGETELYPINILQIQTDKRGHSGNSRHSNRACQSLLRRC